MTVGLVDGNSFYASIERIFDPSIATAPICVLSNNDGAIVALTPEAKALGLKMGTPWFKVRSFAEHHGVVARSSNYELYGDISWRLH